MNIMYQPSSPSSAIFQTIPCDSYDEMDEPTHECFSKSIFRQDQFEDESVVRAPPLVRRANPIQSSIDDEEMAGYHEEQTVGYISPYPLSPCQQELEERQYLSDEIGSLQGDNERDSGVDYSYYFSPLTECDDIQDISFEEELVEGNVNQSVWDDSILQSSTTTVLQPRARASSPAQISVGSSDFDDSRRMIGS